MRILHVINDLRFAGAERLVADLAPRQQSEGFTVSVATLASAQTDLETDLRDAGVSLHLPERPIRFLSPAHIGRLVSLFTNADLVHVHLFPAQLWAAIAAQSLGKRAPRLVTTEHNTHNRRREKPLLKPLDRWMYARYDRILAISGATKEAMIAYLPETGAKITVIPNGVDLARFADSGSPAERAHLFPEATNGATVLLSVGRLTEQKGMDILIDAVRDLPDTHLYIVGEGELRADLTAHAQGASHIHFLGNRGDIPSLLRNADIYIQASRWEGFGIAAVEAMASGLPVVVSDVPGLREVVGDAGIRVPAGDVPALHQALRTLIGDTIQRRARGIAARDRASHFAIGASAGAHQEMYRELLQAPK